MQELYLDQLELLEACETRDIPYREVYDSSEMIHEGKRDIIEVLVFQATNAFKLTERVEDMDEI